MIDFRTDPGRYRHWRLRIEPPVAHLCLDVREDGGLFDGYTLKQNSYDLGVDIELYDATQRLRFEHPEVRAVVIESGKERIFCAGANIGMLGSSSHALKVNFCKFTNETRFAIEDAGECSGQHYLAAVAGTAAGGGYELALTTERILLADDGSSSVSLPEVPLLAVLPGTGGLTRLVDKRRVRRDLADLFCTLEEGVKGRRALEWGLVDELVPRTALAEAARQRALELAATSERPAEPAGIALDPLARELGEARIDYANLDVTLDRQAGTARITLHGPTEPPPPTSSQDLSLDAGFWPLALARELDDAILHLRVNEPRIGLWLLGSRGDAERVAAYDEVLSARRDDWRIAEIVHYWKRVLKRLDVTSRTLFGLVEPGSCFAGFLLEVALACDRTYMFEGERESDGAAAPSVRIGRLSFGALPMPNGLSRLATRFLGDGERVDRLQQRIGESLEAGSAAAAGLVTAIFDDIDWDDEVRIAVEERASFSGDSLTGLEANLRFAGPETLESKVFGRLSAWQNWIFQRPSAAGAEGALKRYGSGLRPEFDQERV